MIYDSKIIQLYDEDEREVVLHVEGVLLTCFVGICPYMIIADKTYPIELHLWAEDGIAVVEVSEKTPDSFTRVGSGFSYTLTGILSNGCLRVGPLIFEDVALITDFQFLDGKKVTVTVDRITAEFT
jgi:hypothetical protein